MRIVNEPPQLPRTANALAAYDAHEAKFSTDMSPSKFARWEKTEQALGRKVGIAFGHDTADRNAMDTCENCVRPCDWLREQVAAWKEREGVQ